MNYYINLLFYNVPIPSLFILLCYALYFTFFLNSCGHSTSECPRFLQRGFCSVDYLTRVRTPARRKNITSLCSILLGNRLLWKKSGRTAISCVIPKIYCLVAELKHLLNIYFCPRFVAFASHSGEI